MSDRDAIHELLVTRLVRLNDLAYGAAAGVLLGLAVFVATIWLVLKGGDVVGPHLSLLSQFFIGYSVSVLGAVIGFCYGFVIGLVGGFIAARVYNIVAGLRDG
jgi:hypothetical protein